MASRKEWERRVRRWRRSGLTAAEFSSREGLVRGTLLWWSSKLQQDARAAEVSFVEVTAAPEVSAIEVTLANGRVVRVPAGFDDSSLERVLAVAERS